MQTIALILTSFALAACGKAQSTTYSFGGLEQNPSTVQASTDGQAVVKSGDWYSQNGKLTVTANGASFDLNDASGALNVPLALNENQGFAINGTYTNSSTGVRENAVYLGSYDSSTETLVVVISVANSGQTLSALTFNYGEASATVASK